jgi:hypothetical protein
MYVLHIIKTIRLHLIQLHIFNDTEVIFWVTHPHWPSLLVSLYVPALPVPVPKSSIALTLAAAGELSETEKKSN